MWFPSHRNVDLGLVGSISVCGIGLSDVYRTARRTITDSPHPHAQKQRKHPPQLIFHVLLLRVPPRWDRGPHAPKLLSTLAVASWNPVTDNNSQSSPSSQRGSSSSPKTVFALESNLGEMPGDQPQTLQSCAGLTVRCPSNNARTRLMGFWQTL